MSGPCDPSAGRAEKANQAPSGEYASDSPTTMTSLAIWIVPVVGEAVTRTLALGDGATSDGDALGSVDGDSEAVGSIPDGSGLAGGDGGSDAGGPGAPPAGGPDGGAQSV